MVSRGGFEPPTTWLKVRRENHPIFNQFYAQLFGYVESFFPESGAIFKPFSDLFAKFHLTLLYCKQAILTTAWPHRGLNFERFAKLTVSGRWKDILITYPIGNAYGQILRHHWFAGEFYHCFATGRFLPDGIYHSRWPSFWTLTIPLPETTRFHVCAIWMNPGCRKDSAGFPSAELPLIMGAIICSSFYL